MSRHAHINIIAQTPTNTNSPADFHNRSVLQQKSLFGAQNYGNTSQINNPNNQSISGPPTQVNKKTYL